MSTPTVKPPLINTSQDPGLEYLNQREIEIAITPTENSTKNLVYEEITQVITNVFQVNAPSGANGQLQFNQGGQYAGDAELQYDPYTDTLTTGKIVANSITITGNANNFKLAGGYNNEVLKTDGNGNLSWANVFPSVSGKSGKFLVTNGVSIDWSNGNYNSFATTSYVDSAIATLVGTAPAMLDTLAEIANVIGQTNDPQYGIISQLANKANVSSLAQVAFSGSYADLSNRPNISTVGTTGNYADLNSTPTIPTTIRDLGISEGTNGQVLTTNGNGNYSFTTVTGGGGTSYDQALNTTNNVTFSSVVTSNISFSNANLEIYTSANSGKSIDIYTDWGGNRGGVEVWLRHNDGVEINTKDGDFTWKFANTGALNFPLTPNVTSAIVVNDNDNEFSIGTDRGNISIWPENSKWLFGADGNLTLPANTFAVNYANGTQVSLGGGGSANTGNITFSDTTITSNNGDVKIHFTPSASPAVEFNFASNGTLTLPGGIVIQNNEVKNTNTLSGEVQITTATTQGDTEKTWAFNHNGAGALIVPEGSSIQSKSNFNITATETGFIKFTNIVDFDTNSSVDDNQINIVNPEASILDLIDSTSANYVGGIGSVVRIVYGPFLSAVGTIIEAFADPGTPDPFTGLPRYQGRIDIVNTRNGDLLKEFSIEHSSTWKFGSDGTTTFPDNTISNPASLLIKSGTDTAQVGSARTIATDSNEGTGAGTPGVVDVAYDNTIIPTYYYPGGGAPNFTDSTITFANGDVRTITSIVATGGYIDITYDGTTTSSPEFPIILKTGNYAAATPAPQWTFGTNGFLTVPGSILLSDGIITFNGEADPGIVLGSSIKSVFVRTLNGIDQYTWKFGTDGSLTLPVGGDIKNSSGASVLGGATYDQSLNTTDNVTFDSVIPTEIQQNATITKSTPNVSVLGATPTVVFSAGSLFTSIKLVIAVEGRLDGDTTNVDHTQTCEATIAATYNTTAEPIISVYGIVYTSPAPLATFTVARNTVAGTIEVTAINSQTTNALGVRVHAIQFVSRYD